MSLLAEVALGLTLLVAGSVGFRLLLVARRTRRDPELWIGLALLLSASGGALEAGSLRMAARQAASASLASGQLLHVAASVALFVAIWRIFHPQRRWAGALALLGSVGTAACWLPALPSEPSAIADVAEARFLFQLFRCSAYAWGAWESLAYHGRMRRRLRLGLADPVITAQFKLWGLASGAMAGILLLAIVAEQGFGVWLLDTTAGLLATAPLGVFASAALYAAFFPPAFYRRWLIRDREGPALLDRLLPARILEGDADSLRRARLIFLAALAALVWGPVFVGVTTQRGAPEIGRVLAAHVTVIALQPFVLRATGSIALAANLILLSVFGVVLLAASATGSRRPVCCGSWCCRSGRCFWRAGAPA